MVCSTAAHLGAALAQRDPADPGAIGREQAHAIDGSAPGLTPMPTE
jgi:hypothetical protein